jgi:triacylglycerol esterase/lipase EstA (alpha/beta hydrolase family)
MQKNLKASGYKTIALNYPSTRFSIEEHVKTIKKTIESLEGYDTLSFVTHSLGGIILRFLLEDKEKWLKNKMLDKIVMLAPPNKGSIVAGKLQNYKIAKKILGPCLKELTPEKASDFPKIDDNLEIGIISGANDNPKGFNPFLKADNDGILKVSETRIDKIKETITINSTHSFIMSSKQAIASTVRFIKSGKFAKGKKPKKQSTKVDMY